MGGGAIISNIFFGGGGFLKFLFFFVVFFFVFFLFFFFFFLGGGGGGCRLDAGSEPTYEEKMKVPPTPPTPTPWDCRMTTTKSCRFMGGRDATVALQA